MHILNRINNRLLTYASRFRLNAARACLPQLDGLNDGLLSLIVPLPSVASGARSEIKELITVTLNSTHIAMDLDISDISARIIAGPKWPDIWPGEHYRLLAALVKHLKPSTIVEIGTFLGLSALTMKKYLPAQGRVVTFDIVPWDSLPETCLKKSDFADGRLVQELGDLANPDIFKDYADLFSKADIIFLDGPKNRTFERAFLKHLESVKFASPPLLVIDDIRLWSMLDIWSEIPYSKLDVTSFGHFSGTGLVRLPPKQVCGTIKP